MFVIPPDTFGTARALADPTRFEVYSRIAEAETPLTVKELTRVFPLHHSAIRIHLRKLEEAGSSRPRPYIAVASSDARSSRSDWRHAPSTSSFRPATSSSSPSWRSILHRQRLQHKKAWRLSARSGAAE